MLNYAKIPKHANSKNVLVTAITSCVFFIIILLTFKYLNLLHFWGLRVANYFIFAGVSIYMVNKWIKTGRGYIPFLQIFGTVFFSGVLSFALLAVFIFFYSFFDPYMVEFFVGGSKQDGKLIPPVIVFFEGSGASIVVSLIAMAYSSRFEDGEASLPR